MALKPDQEWLPGTSAAAAPTYYLPSRSDPYLVKIGGKFVKVQVLVSGDIPDAELEVGEAAVPVVAEAAAEPRGRK